MSDLLPSMPTNGQKIPFFKKPGSLAGTIVLILGAGFVLLHLNTILVFLISLMQNTITFIGLVIALGAIFYMIFDPKIRKIVSEVYFMLVRKLLGVVIEMDPIAIVEHHIMKLKDKISTIQKNMGSLKGLILESKKMVKSKEAQLEHDAKALKICMERTSDSREAEVYQRSVVRLSGIIDRQKARIKEAEKWYEILKELERYAKLTVMDTENEVKERVEEWNMIKKQHKVFSSVMSILKNDDKFNTFTKAMDFMSYDITQKLGEMEDIINETSGVMSQLTLDNAITSEKASELMARYEKFGIQGLLSSTIDNKDSFDLNTLHGNNLYNKRVVEAPFEEVTGKSESAISKYFD